jgi:lipopolysaccharide biosynthesis glycosyltransferase
MKSSNISARQIHLGIAFDQNYIRHFYALFTSILENNIDNNIYVHAIITGVGEKEKKDIEKFATENQAVIHFYEIDETYVKRFVLTNKWSSAVYYRLFFPLLVSENVSRILYLDTDIIVNGDLHELFIADLGKYPVGAVYDNWVKTAPQLGIHDEGEYFNSGVLLINVPEWKKQGVSEKAFAYLEKYPERIM